MVKPVKEVPPSRTGRWARKLSQIMNSPGEWFELDDSPVEERASNWPWAAAHRLRTEITLPSGTTAEDFEFEGRTLSDEGRHVVYGRYLGA